jgi:LmbE family N-acetylglucosaminyl deacetylase
MSAAGNAVRFAARPISGGGTSAEAWTNWGCHFPELDVRACPLIYVVAPHPDDETLGFGASAATLKARGVPVQVVAVSDGEASQGALPARRRRDLARRRRAELHSATEILGLRPPIFLGLPDGEISPRVSELSDLLGSLLAEVPGAWCAATWRGDGHPDHEAVGTAAAAAVERAGGRLLEYPIWMWHWATPGDDVVPWSRASRISSDPAALDRKWLAAKVFHSQYESGRSGEAVLPPFVIERLRTVGEVVFT